MFLRKTTGFSEVENNLWRHRTPLKQARASRKEGVLFFRYHGFGIHEVLLPFAWMYQSQG